MLLGGGVVAVGTAFCYSLQQSVNAHDFALHPPAYPWSHKGLFQTYDHASLRRGYEVYKQVCAACHSLKYVAYRMLIDVTHSKAALEEEAAEHLIVDGPDDDGKMFERPGLPSDYIRDPYPNEEAGRAANNGAYPPDLSLIILARHGGEDYIFSLLTGYFDAPEKVVLPEGQSFNGYFHGGNISMAKALYSEVMEYSDGTPATPSQMAKDVVTFLKWCGEPKADEQSLMLIKMFMAVIPLTLIAWYYHRRIWSPIKNRKFEYKPK